MDLTSHTHTQTSVLKKYLQSKFVEEKVDEVLDAGQDTMIQVLPWNVLVNDTKSWGLQVIAKTKVELVAMNSHLECQQSQYHQMVLQHKFEKKSK